LAYEFKLNFNIHNNLIYTAPVHSWNKSCHGKIHTGLQTVQKQHYIKDNKVYYNYIQKSACYFSLCIWNI